MPKNGSNDSGDENGKQKVIYDNECSNSGAKARPRSMAGCEVDAMVVI